MRGEVTVHIITECEPNRRFTFGVGKPGKAVNTWSYELAPAGSGTDVTESYQLADSVPVRIYWALLGWARSRTNRDGMLATLERMKAELERPA